VRSEEQSGAFVITLEKPPRNVLDLPRIRALHAVLAPLPQRRDLKVVVFRSAIPGTFSAGIDVRDHTKERAPEMLEAFHTVFRLLDQVPQVTLAAVDGLCLGGGCELALFSDIVLATKASTFGQPEVDLGCFPPVAAVLLPRLAGRAISELVFTGASIDAAEAARRGLVTRVVEDLEAETGACVARITSKSAVALAAARKALRLGADDPFAEALARSEQIYRDELLPTADAAEGVRAFLEKRPPRWQDR
jgi:cyclohexa-1,5-dienecarbonyl-CoA hydratase